MEGKDFPRRGREIKVHKNVISGLRKDVNYPFCNYYWNKYEAYFSQLYVITGIYLFFFFFLFFFFLFEVNIAFNEDQNFL